MVKREVIKKNVLQNDFPSCPPEPPHPPTAVCPAGSQSCLSPASQAPGLGVREEGDVSEDLPASPLVKPGVLGAFVFLDRLDRPDKGSRTGAGRGREGLGEGSS